MGTSGYFSYKHRGKFYTRFQRSDSYPEGLGSDLVTAIPKSKRIFEKWLKNKREFFDAEKLRLSELEFDSSSDADETEAAAYGYCQRPSTWMPGSPGSTHWVYIIDLDGEKFVVNMLVKFPLADIPRGEDGNAWIKYLEVDRDGFGNRHIKPSTPYQYAVIRSISPPEPSPSGLDQYSKLKPKALARSEWTSQDLNPSQLLSLHAAEGLIMLHYYSFSTLAMNTPESQTFQTFALGLLSTAAEGLMWIAPEPYIDSERNSDRLLPTFTSWVATKGVERRNACFYWFRDVLVWLASDLDHEANRKAAVGLAVAKIQEHNLDYCIALVFSVRHVIVVKFSGGVVYESELIEVLDAIPDVLWRKRLANGMRPLVHFLRLRDYAVAAAKPNVPSSSNGNSFPTDILLYILQCADNDTYEQFRKLSKQWRDICRRQPRVGPYTIIRRDGDIFCAREKGGSDVRLKLFWRIHQNCAPCNTTITENFEVFIRPQVDTRYWPNYRNFAGRKFVLMRLLEGVYDVRSTDFRLVIAEEGSDMDKTMERLGYDGEFFD
ncbi:hypothetical protein BD410DRAFT_901579 [Rickenella mellea]|uniref:F-box domain-containing protein n=1 Tax=Rickenella mellea TaxID=50990 RepID=A0A4Y7PPY0_9AGAM|nr:hypothetical protein BD410DRAFT_901579 [Rickenella mellea]